MPLREEAGEGLLLDRFDLLAKGRQRTAAELAQDIHVAELTSHAARSELAHDESLVAFERSQRAGDPLRRSAEPPGDVGGQERAVRAGVPADDLLQRTGDRIGERHRQPEREGTSERIAVPSSILRRGEPGLAGERHLDDAALGDELSPTRLPGPRHRGSRHRGSRTARTATRPPRR